MYVQQVHSALRVDHYLNNIRILNTLVPMCTQNEAEYLVAIYSLRTLYNYIRPIPIYPGRQTAGEIVVPRVFHPSTISIAKIPCKAIPVVLYIMFMRAAVDGIIYVDTNRVLLYVLKYYYLY